MFISAEGGPRQTTGLVKEVSTLIRPTTLSLMDRGLVSLDGRVTEGAVPHSALTDRGERTTSDSEQLRRRLLLVRI